MNKIIKTNMSSKEKEKLKNTISKKEEVLFSLLEKLEQLKLDLSLVKQEYNIRIGKLYLRLDEIDLEILKHNKIKDLLALGIPLSEARLIVEEELKNNYQNIKSSYDEFDDVEIDFERKKLISKHDSQELKRLWKELSRKYHPDVAGGNEEIMKKINKAYQKRDLDALREIQLGVFGSDTKRATLQSLKARLQSIERSISKAQKDHNDLLNSEWFILKTKIDEAKTLEHDLLSELENKINEDIEKKEDELNTLKKK